MNLQVGVVGLGSMGFGIAQSLLRSGHTTYGFDVAASQQQRFVAAGGCDGELLAVADTLDALIVVVLNAEQTQNVLFGNGDSGDGAVARMRPGSVVLACATVPPAFARRMEAQCQAAGVHYLDAPISGGSVKAAAGQLSVMAAGTAAAFAAAQPVLDCTAETVFALADRAGAGSAMKAVNQLLAGSHIALMAEALTFGMTQGIEPQQFLDVISRCAGNSWMLENRVPHIIAGDYTPHSSVTIWPKDLGIVLDIAASVEFDAPIAATALQQFNAAVAAGYGHEDDAAVAKVYARQAQLQLPGVDEE